MKSLKFLGVMFTFLLSFSAFVYTGNFLVAGTVGYLVTTGLGYLFDYSEFHGTLAFSTLVAIPGHAKGTSNPGEAKKLWIATVDSFSDEWPSKIDIVGGEITGAPTMSAGATFVEFDVADNSLKIDHKLSGPAGYQSWEHMADLKTAGFSKAQTKAFEALINQEVVIIAQENDGQLVVAGTSHYGLQLEVTHSTGEKGNGARGYTTSIKNAGYQWGVLPLGSSVTIPGVTA